MRTLNSTVFRRTLGRTLHEVAMSGVPTIVERRDGESVIVLRHADYRAMAETLHLMGNPENARRLLRSVRDADRGRAVVHALVDMEPS